MQSALRTADPPSGNKQAPSAPTLEARDISKRQQHDSIGQPRWGQCTPADEGALYAYAYLERVDAGLAQGSELAVLVQFLTGDMLQSFCDVLHLALSRER